jgi:hypothetical protein
MDNETLAALAQMLQAQNQAVGQMLKEEVCAAEKRISLKIENEVSHKIEALFDGYKLTHDKQWELERRLADLEKRLDEISLLVAAHQVS